MRHSVIALLFCCTLSQAETYNECILDNMKGVGSQAGAYLVNKACRNKVLPYVPKKCKQHSPVTTKEDEIDKFLDAYAPSYQYCVNECLNASFWSKHFVDCAP